MAIGLDAATATHTGSRFGNDPELRKRVRDRLSRLANEDPPTEGQLPWHVRHVFVYLTRAVYKWLGGLGQIGIYITTIHR